MTDGGYVGMNSEILAKPYMPQKEKKKKGQSPVKKMSSTQRDME